MSPANPFVMNRSVPQVIKLGRECEPLMQFDGLLRNPGALVAIAARSSYVPLYGPKGGYPGVQTPAPLDYIRAVVKALEPALREVFDLGEVTLAGANCGLSLITLKPNELVAGQRSPHIDTTDPLQFALLHYLCPAEFGGTAFYRHRRTGFETITPERLKPYVAVRASEVQESSGHGYILGDTAQYEQTASVEAAFNRMIIYRSHLLHSAQIAPGAPLSADPRRGRLTANIFLTYRQA